MKKIIYSNLKIYSITKRELNLFQIDKIIQNEPYHLVSLFKEHLIYDEYSEFLKRFYSKTESVPRIYKLNEYYTASSMLFPNYTSLPEGKYIYKNIMKKQKVIDLIEAMDDIKEKEKKKKIKNNKEKEPQKVFDTKIYESIAFDIDNSKIREMFNINIKERDANESIDSIDKLATVLSDAIESSNCEAKTVISINKAYKNSNYTIGTNTLNNTNNKRTNNPFVSPPSSKGKVNSNQGEIKHQNIKLSINPNLKIKLNPAIRAKRNGRLISNNAYSHSRTVTMPSIAVQKKSNISKNKKINNSNLVINYNFLQTLKGDSTYRSREKRRINSNVIYDMFNNSNYRSSSSNNSKYSKMNSKTIFHTTNRNGFKQKSKRKIILNETKIDIMTRNLKFARFSTLNGCLTERKSNGKILKL